MEIIPQEKEADIENLGKSLDKCINVISSKDVRAFLFGSWATHTKSFTEGDVDVFIGFDGYEYNESEELVELIESHVNVHTVDGDCYEDRRIEIHWGDVNDFLKKINNSERKEITNLIV